MSGNAHYGTDYTLGGTYGEITIPAGQSIGFTSLMANNPHVSKVTATITLTPGSGYATPTKAKFEGPAS